MLGLLSNRNRIQLQLDLFIAASFMMSSILTLVTGEEHWIECATGAIRMVGNPHNRLVSAVSDALTPASAAHAAYAMSPARRESAS